MPSLVDLLAPHRLTDPKRGNGRPIFEAGQGGMSVLLSGQFDSPFGRRVAFTLRLYGLAYGQAPGLGLGGKDACQAFRLAMPEERP